MGIDAQLRSETGQILREVGDPQMVLSRAARRQFAGTRLLRYLVPWGDTVFNQAQADDLLTDIRQVKEANPRTPLSEILSEVEPLVVTLSRGDAVRRAWERLVAAHPDAVGHRAGWGDLWFMVPGTNFDRLCDTCVEVSSQPCADPLLDTWVALARGPHRASERFEAIDELAMGLSKVTYRGTFPNALCFRNGTLLHSPW